MSYRAAVIGCGRVGCGFDDQPWAQVRTHAGAYVRAEGVDLAALADVDEEKLARYGAKFGIRARYRDFRDLLARERPDIVSICTKNDRHLEVVEEAVRAGVRGILCEKPFTTSVEEADRAIARCDAAGVRLLVNHSRRFDPFHQRAAAWVQSGGLGRLQCVTARYGAGTLNTGTHLFDLLRLYLGDVAWVRGLLSPNPSGDLGDPNVDMWVGFDLGLQVSIQACDAQAFVAFDVSIAGTEGCLHLTAPGFDLAVVYEAVRPSDRLPGYRTLTPAPCPFDTSRSDELMVCAVENVVASVDGRVTPLSSGRDGRAALAIALAARASAADDGRPVIVPALVESHHVV